MKFYSLFTKSQARYNTPFLALDDDDAISRVSQMLVGAQDPALLFSLNDLQLRYIGAFEAGLPDCIIDVKNHYIVLDDLHDKLPLPPLVRDKVDKLYGLTPEGGETSEK